MNTQSYLHGIGSMLVCTLSKCLYLISDCVEKCAGENTASGQECERGCTCSNLKEPLCGIVTLSLPFPLPFSKFKILKLPMRYGEVREVEKEKRICTNRRIFSV